MSIIRIDADDVAIDGLKAISPVVKRWQDFTGQQATLEGDGRTFEQIDSERYNGQKDSEESYAEGIKALRAKHERAPKQGRAKAKAHA